MKKFYTFCRTWGNNVLVQGYEDGERFREKIQFNPTAFLKCKEKTDWKTIKGDYANPINFDSIEDYKAFVERYDDVHGYEIHGLGPRKSHVEYLWNEFPEDINYDPRLIKTIFFDIEVHTDDPSIGFPDSESTPSPVVTIACNVGDETTIFGLKPYSIKNKSETYFQFQTEKQLLLSFVNWFHKIDPDVISGWNIDGFDVPYLINRISIICGEKYSKKLSPFGVLSSRAVTIGGRTQIKWKIIGVESLDYLEVFKKFGVQSYGPQESFKLDHIASVVLNEKKLNYSDYSNLRNLYNENPQLHTEYCVQDTMLVKRMADLTQYFTTIFSTAYMTRTNFSDVFGTVAVWDSYLYGAMLKKHICVPHEKIGHGVSIEGAYVKDVEPGLYNWLTSFDVSSEYPSVMMQCNISPETIADKIQGYDPERFINEGFPEIPENCVISGSGQLFKKQPIGVLSELIKMLFNSRKTIKKQMNKKKNDLEAMKIECHSESELIDLNNEILKLNSQQMATKILMNSAYGAFGSPSFRYYDPRIAESVTQTGQLVIKSSQKAINQYFSKLFGDEDYVAIVDTDSLYVKMEKFVQKVSSPLATDDEIDEKIKKFAQDKIEPMFDKVFEDLAQKMNATSNAISFKLEGIASKTVIQAKKRYIQNLISSEGVKFSEPKLKIMGIEAVRSSTPTACREMIKEVMKVIMTKSEGETQTFINKLKEKFYNMNIEEIAFPRSANGLDKYQSSTSIYIKGTPIQARASLLYNYHLKKLKLESKYDPIFSGEKMKFVYLRTPNPIFEDVIGFTTQLPKEFGLEKYIDYDTQFNKAFLDPIERILNAMGWNSQEKATLF